jgi:hypothetical protein
MEAIVSKRSDAPYRSSNASDWVKVKCAGWRKANQERWRLSRRRLGAVDEQVQDIVFDGRRVPCLPALLKSRTPTATASASGSVSV